jgi:hypothetical protein
MPNFYLLHEECNKPAFYINHMPETHEKLMASDCEYPDGSKPANKAPICCGSCGKHLTIDELKVQRIHECLKK